MEEKKKKKISLSVVIIAILFIFNLGLWFAFLFTLERFNNCSEGIASLSETMPIMIGERVIVCTNGECYNEDTRQKQVICAGKLKNIYGLPSIGNDLMLALDDSGRPLLMATCLCDDGQEINRPYNYFYKE